MIHAVVVCDECSRTGPHLIYGTLGHLERNPTTNWTRREIQVPKGTLLVDLCTYCSTIPTEKLVWALKR